MYTNMSGANARYRAPVFPLPRTKVEGGAPLDHAFRSPITSPQDCSHCQGRRWKVGRHLTRRVRTTALRAGYCCQPDDDQGGPALKCDRGTRKREHLQSRASSISMINRARIIILQLQLIVDKCVIHIILTVTTCQNCCPSHAIINRTRKAT